MNKIFSKELLAHYLPEFRESSIVGIRNIVNQINSLIIELDLGKLSSSKEEEIKSRFVTTFFGDILGFNYGNSNEWQLREEKKSIVDGKKADAALGYFYQNKNSDIPKAVIEIKDANTDLDIKDNTRNQTPVEQAFSYAPKMGGECRWVIVSNIKEIRFYLSNDASKCQSFNLKDLIEEDKRKELLFLFHKDRFIIKNGKSSTEKLLERTIKFQKKKNKKLHIIDEIYLCLKRFEGLNFINPEYLANLYPFNILKKQVWHYHDSELYTLNKQIFHLLNNIEIKNSEVIFSPQLENDIKELNVIDAKIKLEYSFNVLNSSTIRQLKVLKDYKENENSNLNFRRHFHVDEKNGIIKNINLIQHNEKCNCVKCNYRTFDFKSLLSKLKSTEGDEDLYTMEYAYRNYLVASNNFKTSFNIYKKIEKKCKNKEGKEIEYFIAKYNLKKLYNPILDYQFEDREFILSTIKSIDLNKVIYDEIEFNVDDEIKEYLIQIKENTFVKELQEEIENILIQIQELKNLYDRGGIRYAGPNLPYNLLKTYSQLYYYINNNLLVRPREYNNLTKKVFSGLIASYLTKDVGLIKLNNFIITEAILYINTKSIQEILNPVESIHIDDSCIENILLKLKKLLSSYYDLDIFNQPYINPIIAEYFNNNNFASTYSRIFSNLLIFLSKISITEKQFEKTKETLIKFLKIENELRHFEVSQLNSFLFIKGFLFKKSELIEILTFAIESHKEFNPKYKSLIIGTTKAINKFFPTYHFDREDLIQKLVLNSNSDNKHLIHLAKICSESCKEIIFNVIENQLDTNFNYFLYSDLVSIANYDYKRNDYLKKFINELNHRKEYSLQNNKMENLYYNAFVRFAYIIYKCNIPFDSELLKEIEGKNDFETWLLNPHKFDYKNFNSKWLLKINYSIYLDRLKGIQKIITAVYTELKVSFDSTLAEIKYKYLL